MSTVTWPPELASLDAWVNHHGGVATVAALDRLTRSFAQAQHDYAAAHGCVVNAAGELQLDLAAVMRSWTA